MQMWPGAAPGRTNIANHLALVYMHPVMNSRRKAAHVAIEGFQMITMANDNGIAITVDAARLIDLAITRRMNGRSAWRTEINTCVHLGITQQRMAAHTQAGCKMSARNRGAQQCARS